MVPNMVGEEILKLLRWSMGRTAPSVAGFMNLVECQAPAVGPVSPSPSPTMHPAMRAGLSRTAPKDVARAYPNSHPSCITPGNAGLKWLGKPEGQEKAFTNLPSPSLSRLNSGFDSVNVA